MSDSEKVSLVVSDEEGLSADERRLQREVREEILGRAARTDASIEKLNRALSDARDNLRPESYAELVEAQKAWDTRGRGADINALVSSGVPAADAYSEALEKRAEWVSLRASWAMLVETPGRFGGFYRADSDRTLEIYETEAILNLVMRVGTDQFVFTATGRTGDGPAVVTSEFDVMASAVAVIVEPGKVRVSLGDSFSSSSLAKAGSLIEGVYHRVAPGEINVFAE